MTCTRPGWSPRSASTLATTSSLRMWLLAICSMVWPAAAANSPAPPAHTVTKRLGKSRIVEDADLPRRQKCRHPFCITHPGQRTGDDDPVVAREHPGEALAVTLAQQPPQPPLLLPGSPASILACLVPAWPG